MEIRTQNQLNQRDPAVAPFTPWGLATGGTLTEEASLRFVQGLIADTDLHPDVPEVVRQSFESCRSLHTRGFFQGDLFREAFASAHLALEPALGVRFLQFYEHQVPLHNSLTGEKVVLGANDYAEFKRQTGRSGRYPLGGSTKSPWQLLKDHSFRGDLGSLLRWARRERLLEGQRNKIGEQGWRYYRNAIAHAHQPICVTLLRSADVIRKLAETLNHLWGHDTPGGIHYPAAIAPQIFAIRQFKDTWTAYLASGLPELSEEEQAGAWRLVEAANPLEALDASPLFEITALATRFYGEDLSFSGALDVWRSIQTSGYSPRRMTGRDRVFLIRVSNGAVEPCRNPRQFLALLPEERDLPGSTWWLVRADQPGDAWEHIKIAVDPSSDWAAGNRQMLTEIGLGAQPAEQVRRDLDWSGARAALWKMGLSDTPLSHR
ncbi:MAG TPA: hypothetical protein VFJ58_17095 [Armatimonadota bacterium]|nr:hypothetical protein [Armatimonadota bacterium]